MGTSKWPNKVIFFTIPTVLISVLLKSSVIGYLQYIWGNSRPFWTTLWGSFLQVTGKNEYILLTIVPIAISFLTFWIINIPFLVIDLTGKPSFLYAYKTQDKEMVTWKQVRKAILVALGNQATGILGSNFFYFFFKWRQRLTFGLDLPTFQRLIFEQIMFVLIVEVSFYYSHRMLHHPIVYKRIHKVHHAWTAPIGITAFYCHPVEYNVSNIFPLVLGPLLCGTHIVSKYLWVVIATANTCYAHSGYHFPMMSSTEAHDYHHLKFHENFGVLGFLDYLHGTDKNFRRSIYYKRHKQFCSWTPMKYLIRATEKEK